MLPRELAQLLAQNTGHDNHLYYSISPFGRRHIAELGKIAESTAPVEFSERLATRFGDKHLTVTKSGRGALELALRQLNLSPRDEVWIETTTNNFYISGCVTGTIEKFCRWSRTRSDKTKVILVNHEFGFPVENVERYLQFGLPLIEDCAFSFLSENSTNSVGRHADFVIASFPKFLPLPWGGALYSASPPCSTGASEKGLLVSLVNAYVDDIDQIRKARLENYKKLEEIFSSEGYSTTFEVASYHTPGVFMFDLHPGQDNLAIIKQEMNGAGIQSSIFYGKDAYFIPCHHELDHFDVEYMAEKTITTFRKWQ
jgi:dTDP-4-amino-4,6-dideoxygalactose transaminase